MNRRNKGKGPPQSSLKSTVTAKAAAPPPPKPPTPPAAPAAPAPTTNPVPPVAAKAPPAPPPQRAPSPCTLCRAEWKAFQTWLAERRAERDKRLAEARAPPKPVRSFGLDRKPAHQPTEASVTELELSLNTELSEIAHEEWQRRLAVKGLREEDWTDLTEGEMRAVEDAFLPPEAPILQPPSATREGTRYGLPGHALSGNTTALGNEPPSSGPSSFAANSKFKPPPATAFPTHEAWNPSGSSKPPAPAPTYSSGTQPQFGDISNQQQTRDPASRQVFMNDAKRESPWDSVMRPRAKADYSAFASTAPTQDTSSDSLWGQVMSGKKPCAPSKSTPLQPEPQEGPWDATLRAKAKGSPKPAPNADSGESLWASVMTGKSSGLSSKANLAQPDSESPWDAMKRTAGISRSSSSSSQDMNDSSWDLRTPESMFRSMSASTVDLQEPSWQDFSRSRSGTSKPVISSPLASYEPQNSEDSLSSSSSYRVINPTTIELEAEDHIEAGFEGLSQEDVESSIREFYSRAAEAEIELRRQLYDPSTNPNLIGALLEEFIRGMEVAARGTWEDWKERRDKEMERRRLERERENQRRTEAKKPVWGSTIKRGTTPAPPPAQAPLNKKPGKKAPAKKEPEVVSEPQWHEVTQNESLRIPGSFQDVPDASAGRRTSGPANRAGWSAGTSARSSTPVPPQPTKKASIPLPQQPTATPWSTGKRAGDLGKATVTDEEDEEDEETGPERIAREKQIAERIAQQQQMSSPFKWMNADTPSGRTTPKPETQRPPSSQNVRAPTWEQPVPERAAKAAPPASARFRTWTPEKPVQDSGDTDDETRMLFENAMRNIQGDPLASADPGEFNSVPGFTTQAARVVRQERKRTVSSTRR
ncbi:hypothetical protein EUX98_g1645 [Antrodiella citrinella]|uniref:Uncharacterized protein n=1 Tax=Antrodiella citrinella TaxID=2447956 RepID=A0A4S4N117_9APHY|nr:hypothetical protein EUX98_g1645 [Antrodiella citrinella]